MCVEDQLLITLQYWHEYRTQFHSGLDFGVSESSVCRIVAKVETMLVQSGRFRLPGNSKLRFCQACFCLADKGYQGIAKVHPNSTTPQKKPPRKPLPQADKANRVLARLACNSRAWN